jgi:hypothetical protein
VIEALITGVVAITVCMINNFYQSKEIKAKNQETIDMIDYKLSELTKRVDKHNSVIDRTYRLEQATAVQDEQIKVANQRINDLEGEK